MSKDALVFTSDNFESEVLQSPVPVLVDFKGEYCAPCKAIEPIIQEIAGEYAGKAKVGTVTVDENPSLSVGYRISGVPTILIFKGGSVINQFTGLVSKSALTEALDASQ